ncbi:reverse transcriptase domain-containing protein [Tanacetum coccineum]
MKCQPLYFKGTEGVVEVTQWFERMETVFRISNCSMENQIKFSTFNLLAGALTWWNSHVLTISHDVAYAMTWVDLRKKMTDKYCPRNEMKKIEAELWNLKVKGTDVIGYVDGLPDIIHGNIVASKPKTMQEAVEMATKLMDKKVSTIAERQAENKRKFENTSQNNQNQQEQNKRQNTGRAYTAWTGEKKPYGGSKPLCAKCTYHHDGPCALKCHKCNKFSHFARDCRSAGNANNANNQRGTRSGQKPTCFKCGVQGHFKRECPKLKNHKNLGNQVGNDIALAKVYAVGHIGTNPDSNVVTGTFLLNNRYASILFDTGADRSFVSTAFSSQIDITPSTLDHYYDVELANGRIIGRFQQNPGELHWTAMKNILKYLRNTKDMFLVYGGNPEAELRVDCYCDAGFETDRDDTKSQTGYVFILNGGAVDWKSSKQSTTAMSATEAEYIAASEAAMEAVWIRKFISGLGIVPTINEPIRMFCDNSAALHFANEPGVQRGARHYHRRYHYVRESIALGEIRFLKVHTDDNLADPFTKALPKGKLTQHARSMGLRLASSFM